jgi:hypothetical protein
MLSWLIVWGLSDVMKARRVPISKQTPMTVGLMLTVCGLVWKAALKDKQVDVNTASIVAINGKLDQILEMKTDIAVIKHDVAALQKPVRYTRRDVKEIRKDVALKSLAPIVPFYIGPLTTR